eukprot:TRINITY_DN4881_c0_g2_i12.p1 TRINITY_DN4881_c0_g2~~TRINITY_DN4881_c0_g2_i12.p1  ORF type:complete len:182 (+),score=19.66 TRINITY_DN4881_c0_g2_i12:44-589(+)
MDHNIDDYLFFFFQAEDGIRDRSPSRGLGDVYKRQVMGQRAYICLVVVRCILQLIIAGFSLQPRDSCIKFTFLYIFQFLEIDFSEFASSMILTISREYLEHLKQYMRTTEQHSNNMSLSEGYADDAFLNKRIVELFKNFRCLDCDGVKSSLDTTESPIAKDMRKSIRTLLRKLDILFIWRV